MAEEIQTFLLADRTQDRADSSPQPGNCPLCGLAQECLVFAEDLFDRAEIRRIGAELSIERAIDHEGCHDCVVATAGATRTASGVRGPRPAVVVPRRAG